KGVEESIKLQNIENEEAFQRIMEDRRKSMDQYKSDLNNKMLTLEGRLDSLKERIMLLQEQRENTFNEYSVKLAQNLDGLTFKDGEQVFKNCTNEQKETFAYEYLRRAHITERQIMSERNELETRRAVIDNKIEKLDSEIKLQQSTVSIGDNVNGELLVGYNSKKKV